MLLALFSLQLKWCSLVWRSHSYSFLKKTQFTYMIFIFSQSLIHHSTSSLWTNITTSSQLANVSSVGRALHRYCKSHEFKSHKGLKFFRPYFHYCLRVSSVYYCEDWFHIHNHYCFHNTGMFVVIYTKGKQNFSFVTAACLQII